MCARTRPRDLIVGRRESSIPARLIWDAAAAQHARGKRADNKRSCASLLFNRTHSTPAGKTKHGAPPPHPRKGPGQSETQTQAEPAREEQINIHNSLVAHPRRGGAEGKQQTPGQTRRGRKKQKRPPGRTRSGRKTQHRKAPQAATPRTRQGA